MSICDYCKKICKKTPFGSCVILTKSNITLCIECNSNRLKVEAIKNKQNNDDDATYMTSYNNNYLNLLIIINRHHHPI